MLVTMDHVTLDDLSGATLDTITIDWRNGIVLVTFLNVTEHDESCAIRAAEFSRVEVPRAASSSKTVKSASRTNDLLVVTMQSGETLRIESKKFAIDVLS